MRPYYLYILFILVMNGGVTAKTTAEIPRRSQPLYFIENKGQVIDQYGQHRADIQYSVATPGMTLFIGNGQLHYQWNKKVMGEGTSKAQLDTSRIALEMYRMDVKLAGANTFAVAIADEKQDFFEQYIQQYGLIEAHSYNKITYKNVYPNIDWVLYIKDDRVEYDFVVHPGGHVRDIQIQYGGTNSLKKTATGSIVATTPVGTVTEQQPYSYVYGTMRSVTTSFKVKENTIGFDVAPYDGTLVIDPTLAWATYYGGYGTEAIYASTACDTLGNVFMAGLTTGGAPVATVGSYAGAGLGYSSAFIAKFNSAGTRLWCTYFGSYSANNSQAVAFSIACDPQGNVVIAGRTTIGIGTTAASYQPTYGGGSGDAFITKFSGSGSFLWSTYYGGTAYDAATGVICDKAGNIFVCGNTYDNSGTFATTGCYQGSNGGSIDVFLSKFNSSGARQWSTYFGGSGDEAFAYETSVACDGSDNIYLASSTNSTNLVTTSACLQGSFGGGISDCFLTKFTNAGAMIWSTYLGGVGEDLLGNIATDSRNNVYVAGSTYSSNNIATAGSYQSSYHGNSYNALLVKLDSTGSRQWGTYFGGTSSSSNSNSFVACDAKGNVLLGGNTNSTSNIATTSAYQSVYGGGYDDGFIAQFDSSGSKLWGSYYGGAGQESVTSVACDKAGHIYMVGYTTGQLNMSNSSFQPSYAGGAFDDFLVKFSLPDTIVYMTAPFTDILQCAGNTVTLPYFTTFPFRTGNIFTVQLSNAAGSFASAVVIGSVTATSSGTISCTIPYGIPSGIGYRYRIISSSPSDTSLDDGKDIRIMSGHLTAVSPLCPGGSLVLLGQDLATGITYNWVGPNSLSATSVDIIRSNAPYADSGNYYLTEYTSECSVVDTFHVVIKIAPLKPVAGSNSAVCKGAVINLTSGPAFTGTTWHWTGPNSFNSLLQNPVRTPAIFADTGRYIVTATLNGCNIADTTHVVVLATPDTSYVTGKPILCIGDSLKLNGNVPNTGAICSWTGPNNFYATTRNISIANTGSSNSGTYYFTTSMGNVCVLQDTLNVQVLPRPVATLADTFSVCQANTLNIILRSSAAGVTYNWAGPNSFTSTTKNPSISNIPYVDSGKYIVSVANAGCLVTDSTYVTVASPPLAPILIYAGSICSGDSLNIIAPAQQSGSTWHWAGPGNYNSSQASISIPNATISNSGSYYLSIANGSCSINDTVNIIVKPLPTITGIATNSPLCAGATLSLASIDTAITGVRYSWTGPNGFIAAGKTTTRIVGAIDRGNYKVISTINGCSVSDSTFVTVNPLPAGITYSSNSPVCAGDTLKINSNSITSGAYFTWTGPNGTIYNQNSFVIPTATTAGGGRYALAISYNSCIVYDTLTVLIRPLPATPVAVSNSPLCAGATLNLTASDSTAGAGYVWTGPGFSSMQQGPQISNITYADTGIYTVSAILNGCYSASPTIHVALKPSPAGSAASNSPICAGDTLLLSASSSQLGVVYRWSGPLSFTSAHADTSVYNANTAATGTYSVLLSLNGCTTSLAVPVTIISSTGLPVVQISTATDTVCSLDNTIFIANAGNAGANAIYAWKINGRTALAGISNIFSTTTLRSGDVVSCTITSYGICRPVDTATSNGIKMYVQASHPPPVSIVVSPLNYAPGVFVTFTALTPEVTNCLSYQWRKNGIDIPGATTSSYKTYNVNMGDKISLYIHSTCACTRPDTLITNIISLTVGNVSSAGRYKIYPDPAHNEVTIERVYNNRTISIEIFDMAGRKMPLPEVHFVNNIAKVALSFPAGVYMLHLLDDTGISDIQRLVIIE